MVRGLVYLGRRDGYQKTTGFSIEAREVAAFWVCTERRRDLKEDLDEQKKKRGDRIRKLKDSKKSFMVA